MIARDESLGGAGEVLRQTFAGEGAEGSRVADMIAEGNLMADAVGCAESHNPYF